MAEFSWVSIKRRLPINNDKVLLAGRDGVFIGYYDGNIRKFVDHKGGLNEEFRPESITYWANIPQPPE